MDTNKTILISDNNQELFDEIVKQLQVLNLYSSVTPLQVSMFGLHSQDSIIKTYPQNDVFVNLDISDVVTFIAGYYLEGKTFDELKANDKHEHIQIESVPALYHKQLRLVLRNCGVIDPESIENYLDRDGYKALATVLKDYSQDDIIDEIKTAGIRGRGGAGFPTNLKWNFAKSVDCEKKYVVCNADEGDPGAYMDRSVLEGDPHSVLEGMAIAARAIGSDQGFLYVRAEYPLAISRLQKAIDQATERGLLGDNIMGTDFTFNIEIRLGAGAFVCGEETALIASIEGNRGMPKPRPPYPSINGLWGKPTVINNVETLANIPLVFLKGGEWYNNIGTKDSKGTKVFALTGKVKHSGLVEVPMGTTLNEIIYDVGGGIVDDNDVKAVQTGGPSGGMIPAEYFDTHISYESLLELGSMMGSGGMIVMDEKDCIIDVTKFYLQFSVDESCGKCSPCRIGGKQLLSVLEKIANGTIEKEPALLQINKISQAMQNGSLCGLGQSTPNPVISSLRYFEDEILEHIEQKVCKTHKCKDLIKYTVIEDKCIGCHLCFLRCPTNAIKGERKGMHEVIQENCIKCGLCFDACSFEAILIS